MCTVMQMYAQTPQGFNYQATVRDGSGNLLLSTNVNFRFNLIQGLQTNAPIYTETHTVVTDGIGQVSLVIGQGVASVGAFTTIDWSLGNYSLAIELDTGNGYTAMGTTQLLSVPYALYAANSGSAPAVTPSLEAVLTENNTANNQQIKDLQDPTDTQDAATKNYVDTEIQDNKQTLAGVLTEANNASGLQIKGLADPTDAEDAVTKQYIYSKVEVEALVAQAVSNAVSNLEGQIDGAYGDEVEDIDGNWYDYIAYGGQVWTVEDAAMVTYRDGTPIPQVTDNTAWANLTTGAWCYKNNDPTQVKFYNWYAVMGIHDNDPSTPNKILAPEGWHVPSVNEGGVLIYYLIANGFNYDGTLTGNKIAKAVASKTGFPIYNSNTYNGYPAELPELNNDSGFNASPDAFRAGNGLFNDTDDFAFFWTSTQDAQSDPTKSETLLNLSFSDGFGAGFSISKKSGIKVRFVKD